MTTAPVILAMDISKRNTGICVGPAGSQPEFMSVKCAEGDDDMDAAGKLGLWLIDASKIYRPAVIWIEAALQVIPHEWDHEKGRAVAKGNPAATIAIAHMCGAVGVVARGRNIPIRRVASTTARKSFLGNGRPDDPKRAAMAMCRLLGWPAKDFDQADAAAVWFHGCTVWAPRFYTPITPMLQSKALTEAVATAAMAARKGRARA